MSEHGEINWDQYERIIGLAALKLNAEQRIKLQRERVADLFNACKELQSVTDDTINLVNGDKTVTSVKLADYRSAQLAGLAKQAAMLEQMEKDLADLAGREAVRK